ncbi:MAG: hypothetical protein AAFQ07_01155, partial [Chloroflexota bacterium]
VSCNVSVSGCFLQEWQINDDEINTLISDATTENLSLRDAHIDLHPDGRLLALGVQNQDLIRIIDPETLTTITTFSYTRNEPDRFVSVEWNSSGDLLAVITTSNVHIWEAVNP